MYFKNNSAQYRGGALFVEDNPFTYCILDSDAQAGVRDACLIQMHKYQGYCTPRDNLGPDRLDDNIFLQFQRGCKNFFMVGISIHVDFA